MIHFKTFRRRPCFNLMSHGVPLLIIGPSSLAMSGNCLAIGQSSSSSQVGVSTDGAGTSIPDTLSKSHLRHTGVQGRKNKSH